MKSIVIWQRLSADANHTIHVTLPPEMGMKWKSSCSQVGRSKPPYLRQVWTWPG